MTKCFDQDQLTKFLLGNLPDEICNMIEDHILDCETCEDTVVGLERESDTLVSELKQVERLSDQPADLSPPNDPFFESAFENAIQQRFDVANANRTESDLNVYPGGFPSEIGDYRIIAKLGAGAMGSVFLAKHKTIGQEVAIKILSEGTLNKTDSLARFTRELRIIGSMNHPSIVKATDGGKSNGIHFLVMELIDGLDLNRISKVVAPIPLADACELVRQAAIGLQYAHEQGVVHRDVKPANILLSRDGSARVCDLGLATLRENQEMEDQLTMTGQLLGTLDYMAPEQCGGEKSIDARSDVYGLASTLYRLMTGHTPYSDPSLDTQLKKLKAISSSQPTPIGDRLPSLDVKLAAIIDQCLSRDPQKRIQSAQEFADALQPFSNGHRLPELLKRAESANTREIENLGRSKVEREFDAAAVELKTLHESRRVDQKFDTPRKQQTQSSFFSNWRRITIALALLGGFLAMGIVITIQLSTGQLVIESEVDDISVTLVRDETPVKDLQILRDAKTTRLRAGKYRVVIRGKSDAIVVRNEVFEIKRGETVIAKISHAPKSETSQPPGPDMKSHVDHQAEFIGILRKSQTDSTQQLIGVEKRFATVNARLEAMRRSKQQGSADYNMLDQEARVLHNLKSLLKTAIVAMERELEELSGQGPSDVSIVDVALKQTHCDEIIPYLSLLQAQKGPVELKLLDSNTIRVIGSASKTRWFQNAIGAIDVEQAPLAPQSKLLGLFPSDEFIAGAREGQPDFPHPDWQDFARTLAKALPRDGKLEQFQNLHRLVQKKHKVGSLPYPYNDRKTIFINNVEIQHQENLADWFAKIKPEHDRMFAVPIAPPARGGQANHPNENIQIPKELNQVEGWVIELKGHHYHNSLKAVEQLNAGRWFVVSTLIRNLLQKEFTVRGNETLRKPEDYGIYYPTITHMSDRGADYILIEDSYEEVFRVDFEIELAWIPRTNAEQLAVRKRRLAKEKKESVPN